MQIQEMLKTQRKKQHLTQEQVARELMVTTQAISKWETGQAMPSIDNLLRLSDLYNVSVDALIQGSPHFKKPRVIGKRFTYKKGLFFLLIWTLISLYFTGFSDQRMRGLFLLIMMIGLVLVFPTLFPDYWVIEQEYIDVQQYSQNYFRKLTELMRRKNNKRRVYYKDIKTLDIIYRKKIRFSPFDINPDSFYVMLHSTEGEAIRLDFDRRTSEYLPQFIAFLSRKQVAVIDSQMIIEALVKGASLSEHCNSIKPNN